jgi:hypothetical protein
MNYVFYNSKFKIQNLKFASMRLIPIFFLLLLISSCLHKEEKMSLDVNDKLEFSKDTIFFDTLFSATPKGSITQRLKVYNRNDKAVTISSIELGGKLTSPYKVFVNGKETVYEQNVSLRGGDSLYILVSVNIESRNESLPFIVADSLIFQTNGNRQKVDLVAYGQDAIFLNNVTLPCNEIWNNTKPYVIYNSVRVASGCTLTIQKGTKIYFHDDAQMNIEGSLLVQGEKGEEVIFTSDKFGKVYEELPGQWEGIIFAGSSKNNEFNWAVVKNALTGLKILNDPADADTIAEVKFINTIVKNMQNVGVEAQGTDVYAENSIFANTVAQTFLGSGGGNYHFKHCTFASYSFVFFREQPALEFTNDAGTVVGDLKTRLSNCIIWGGQTNELSLLESGTSTFDLKAISSVIKTTRTDQNVNGNLINIDPQFQSPVKLDLHLKDSSPAINQGQNLDITNDLDGKLRDATPDIGAYEK